MDVVVFNSAELPIALGALRALCPHPSPRQQHFLEVIARLHGVVLQARDIEPVANERVVFGITYPRRRKRLVQLAVIMTMVDQVTAQAAAAVDELARATGVKEPSVRTLRVLAARHRLRTRFQVMRRMLARFVKAAYRQEGMRGVRKFLGALFARRGDRTTAERYARLAGFPHGSLGNALYLHCTSRNFGLPGYPGGLPERALFHDVGHLLSGYDTDPDGEIQQAAFQAGFVRTDGFAFLFFGIIQFHLGIKITPVAEAEVGFFDIEKVMTALARGAACTVDLSQGWSFWADAGRPLSQMRGELRIPPPLHPKRLAA